MLTAYRAFFFIKFLITLVWCSQFYSGIFELRKVIRDTSHVKLQLQEER